MSTSGTDHGSSATRAAGSGRPAALRHLRVLDVSQVMAGPFCCMLLGDMGADVIKVEPPAAATRPAGRWASA